MVMFYKYRAMILTILQLAGSPILYLGVGRKNQHTLEQETYPNSHF
jgi:hypothetical protein